MKTSRTLLLMMAMPLSVLFSCQQPETAATAEPAAVHRGGQSAIADDESQKDIVKTAIGSPDHSTLVAALKAADYVDALSNAGPFTVFAPVNAAFDALPAGTLDKLLKKENQADLRNILEYHVYVGVLRPEMLQDGQRLGQVSGHTATITKNGEDIMINDAKVLGTAQTSNGIIYVIDKVLLPPA